jgi:O-antigen ligase
MRPSRVIFYLLCFFIAYSEALKVEFGPLEISLPYMLALFGLLFLMAEARLTKVSIRDWNLRLYSPAVLFCFIYLVLGSWAILRTQLDSHLYLPDALFRIIEQLGRLVLCLCIMVFVSSVVNERSLMVRGIKVMGVSAGFVGAYGIYQVIGTFLGFYRPLIPHTGSYGLAEGVEGASRAIGTMQEPSFLAGFLCFSIIMTMMSLIAGKDMRRMLRLVLWISLVVQALALVMTSSSGGFVGLVVGLCATAVMIKGRVRFQLLAVLVGVAIIVAIPAVYIAAHTNLTTQLVTATIGKATHGSAIERTEFIRCALRMFADHPLIGVGPGLYSSYVLKYTSAFSIDRVLIANNVYAELLAETGIVGFIGFIVLLWGVFRRAIHRWYNSGRKDLLAAGLPIALISLLVQFLAYPTFKMEFIWFLFGLAAAAFGSGQQSHRDRSAMQDDE